MNRNERGGIITLFAIVLGLAVMVAALVVDHGKEELTVENLQRSADAAALAGARLLNGRIDGWREAKKAAMHSIRRNSVHSVGATTLSSLRLTDGPASYWDTHDAEIPDLGPLPTPPSLHRGTRGSAGEIDVQFERGTLWADPENVGKFKFYPLEDAEDGIAHYTSTYLIANAVRARITLRSLPTSFARILGVASFDTLTREAIAVADAELVRPVLPIAIPSCVLNHNRDPHVTTGSHLKASFDVKMACEGRMIASFTNARGDLSINLPGHPADIDLPEVSRRLLDDGFERLEAQIPRPYTLFSHTRPNVCFDANTLTTDTPAHNCKASIRYAYLGVPGYQARESANEHEVVNAIRNRPAATVGMYFKPLNDLFSLRTDVAASESIAQAFDSSPTKFSSVFIVGGRPTKNYPFLRTSRPIIPGTDPLDRPNIGGVGAHNYDVRRNYPSNGINAWGQENIEKILMGKMDEQGGMGHLNYTLPLCNWRSVPPNNPNNGVITGYAMVIDPGAEGAPYCDHRYDGQRKEAVAAIPASEPIITGFVKVVLSGGFNFIDYRTTNPPPPPGSAGLNPSITNTVAIPAFPTSGGGVYYDDNIAYLDTEGTEELTDLKNRSSQYSEEFLQHVECVGDTGERCGDSRPSTSELRPDFPADLERCFDFRGLKVQLAVITAQLNTTTPTRVCREVTSCSDPGSDPLCPCPRWEYSSGDRNIIDQMLSNLNQLWEQPIRANPFTSCGRPVVTGATDLNDPASYGAWRPLEAGAGCNGFDMSLSCDGNVVSLATGKDWMDNTPALITEE